MAKLFQRKIGFTDRFKQRNPLRLHMALILATTVFSGFLATRILLALHLEKVLIRYPLAVVFAYLVFFLLVKLWLKHVAVTPAARTRHDRHSDYLDVVPDLAGSGPEGSAGGNDFLLGGGGEFSGAGASASFPEADALVGESDTTVIADGGDLGSSFGEAAENVAGEAATAAFGDESGIVGIVVLAVLGVIVALVLGAGIYLIYEAPFILSEAAFEFVLAAGLLRGSRRLDAADWMGSVFKTTWIPFAATLLLATLVGLLITVNFPGVTRISELFMAR
jgi:hypothetical protein